MDKLSPFTFDLPRVDLDAEVNGKWHTYRGDIRFRIARINNHYYLDAVAESMKDSDGLSPDEKEEVACVVYSRTILKDWSGVNDQRTGKPVEYTADAGYALLINEEYKDIARFILNKSRAAAEAWELSTKTVGNE